jgi:hypothetical protein
MRRALSSRGLRRATQSRQRDSPGRQVLPPWPLGPSPSQSAERRGSAEGHRAGRRRVRREASAREDRRAYPSIAADHRGICRTSRGRSPAFHATEPERASRHTGRKRPDVEVLHAVASVHVVPGSALAWSPAQEAPGVPARALRIPAEQLCLGVGGQRGQPTQVSYFDTRKRPIRVRGHTAILSRRTPIHPMPQRTVCGRCGRGACLADEPQPTPQ